MRVFAIAAALLGGLASANATDINIKATPVSAAPVAFPTWAGGYLGGQVGYGYDWSNLALTAAGSTFADLAGSPNGWTGGGRAGYDWNTGGFVFGVVGDINYAGFNNAGSVSGALNWSTRTNWWSTEDVRVGYSQFGNHVLLYGLGGIAAGGKTLNVTGASMSDTSWGWNVGAGLGVKIAPNMEVFAEAKYIDLGSISLPMSSGVAVSQNYKFGVFMGGVNIHF